MCGIAGRVNLHGPASADLVAAMTHALAHRGPDDAGMLVDGSVALGHRRLSIIDLAGGAQPMANEERTVWLVYNGEVYNHDALRRELAPRHRFRTRSDTEAVIHLFEEEGAACVRKLRGMFAFAAWDSRRRRLVLARDRLGIKPLFYAHTSSGIAFASELRALLLDPSVDRSLDDEALACYLALRYVPGALTLCRGVRKLEPGCVLTWERGAIAIERYWDLADLPIDESLVPTAAEAAAELRERIDECVEMRLMSEVPLGALLSGGIDSTLVTAAMNPRGRRIKTFAVGYDDHPGESELGWASHAAHALGTDHREVHLNGHEAARALPEVVRALDEPVSDPAAVPLWFLARRAREEVTVVLSGEGGDELLAGYAIYPWMMRMERLRAVGGGPLGRLLSMIAPTDRVRRAATLLGRPLERRYLGVSRAFDDPGRHRLVGEGASACDRAVEQAFEPLWAATRGMGPLRRMLYLDYRTWLPDDLLAKADRITMAAGLELRVPLLDHTLVEYAWTLPDRFKIRGGEGKWLLRRAARGRVPQGILARPKRGFSTPTAAWLRGPMRALARDALLHGDALAGERFDRRVIEALLVEHGQGAADHSSELWALMTLELWRSGVRAITPMKDSSLLQEAR